MNSRLLFFILVPVLVTAGLIFQVTSDNPAQNVIAINLRETSDTLPRPQMQGCAFSHHSDNPLPIAISGVLSPGKTLEGYRELLTYMGYELDKQVSLIQRTTYSEINDLIEGKHVSLGVICSLDYVQGNADFGMELLLAPQINGETVYYSYLIVPNDSNAEKLDDLKDASFAFTDPLSNSGYLAPSYQISLLEESSVSFFGRQIFTYSHDNSVYSVANKIVDGAAVDSLVYEQMVTNDPEMGTKTKVIARYGPYGMPPLVVHPDLNPQMKDQLRDFFLNLHNSREGKKILNDLGIDKFVEVSDSAYDSIRMMKKALGW
jgi:phosphonate transport system substrate-binding protein